MFSEEGVKGAIICVIRYTTEKRDGKTLETLLLTLRRSESGEGERERRGEESRRGRRGVREKGATGSLSNTCTCSSLGPRPPPFYLLFAFTIIHGSGRPEKPAFRSHVLL